MNRTIMFYNKILSQELMAAVTGAVWKCAFSPDNVDRFQEVGLIPILVKILKDNCDALDDLQVHFEHLCTKRKQNGSSSCSLLQFNPQKIGVLTNVVGAISECAKTMPNVIAIKVSVCKANDAGRVGIACH